jgi:hypothetical protein
MSTTAVPSITTENYTLSVVKQDVVDDATKEVSTVLSVLPEDKAKEKATKEGGTVYTATASIPIINDEGAFTVLVADQNERLNIINRGLKVKLQNKFRSLLRDTDEAGNLAFDFNIEGALDMSPYANEPSNTRKSTMEKVMEQLSSLTPAQAAQIFAMLQQKAG